MRHALLALLALIALGAYAAADAVTEFVQKGEASEHALRSTPNSAAMCMSRRIEQHRGIFTATYKPADGPMDQEFIVHMGGQKVIAAVVRMVSTTEGTQATIWTAKPSPYPREEFIRALIEGC
jgi:hypothetical protein